MQEQYISLGDKNVDNGQYMLAVYKILRYDNKSLLDVASELTSECSTGSNVKVGSATNFSMSLDGKVYKVDEENNLAYIAYPWRIFDSGGNIQNILTFIAGNVFGMSSLAGCKLLDVYFPPQMLTKYDGPSTTLDDLRNYLKVYDRPILGTIIKPKIGLTPNEYAELCRDFWVGGGDFVKNDEPQADQDFSPFKKTVEAVRMAMDSSENETGRTKVHSFNVSAGDFDTMIERADYVQNVMKPGSYAFLVDGITAGWTAVQTIRRKYPNVFLHFHRAGHGAFTRPENPFGFSVPVLVKFARLAGASGMHAGTAGVGKMKGDNSDDLIAFKQCLKLQTEGEFFKQTWSKVGEEDSDIQTMIKAEKAIWDFNTRELSLMRKEAQKIEEHTLIQSSDWRTIKKTAPIASGGMNPVLLPEFLDTIGTLDFIITMGGGVHSHPMQTTAGMKAMLEAFYAWQEGKGLSEASKDNIGSDVELQSAMRYFDKKKKSKK